MSLRKTSYFTLYLIIHNNNARNFQYWADSLPPSMVHNVHMVIGLPFKTWVHYAFNAFIFIAQPVTFTVCYFYLCNDLGILYHVGSYFHYVGITFPIYEYVIFCYKVATLPIYMSKLLLLYVCYIPNINVLISTSGKDILTLLLSLYGYAT